MAIKGFLSRNWFLLVLLLAWFAMVVSFIQLAKHTSCNPSPKPRGTLIVLVRAPGDTVSFIIPPECERTTKGDIISF